jgi:aarF domain-containing kinase
MKMNFMCFQGDYAALLSAFTEIGLKLRMDMPEDAMQVTNFFFRRSIPGKESPVSWITLSNLIGVA